MGYQLSGIFSCLLSKAFWDHKTANPQIGTPLAVYRPLGI